MLVGLAPQAMAAPAVSAASAGTKQVGHQTYTWGSVSEPGAREVWTEVRIPSGWSRSQTSRTDGNGRFTIELTYGLNTLGDHRWRVGARTSAGVVYSPEFTLKRTPWTVGSVDSKPVGQLTNAWGTLPLAAGRSVWTEAQVNGRWSRSQVRTANGSGYFAIPLTYGASQVGKHTFRVGAQTSRGTIHSAPFVLQRTKHGYSVTAHTAGTKQVGQATNTWGTVHGHGGGEVFTQVKLSSGWSTSQVRRANASGYFVIPLTYGANTAGTYTWRVGARTPAGVVYSSAFTLRRTAPTAPTSTMDALLTEVNRVRAAGAKCGPTNMPPAGPLTWSDKLAKAAQGHSRDMATKQFVGHTGSDGSSLSDRIERTGYRWWVIGENVAAGQRSVDEVMRGWMESDSHCRNIMNPNFEEFGGALETNSSTVYRNYWTQVFASPSN